MGENKTWLMLRGCAYSLGPIYRDPPVLHWAWAPCVVPLGTDDRYRVTFLEPADSESTEHMQPQGLE